MSDPVRQALVKIIARHGHSVCDDPRRCEGLLRDVCGDYKREIFILINALKEGITADLLAFRQQSHIPPIILFTRLTKRLQDNCAFSDDDSWWAVESWALALGVSIPSSPPPSAPPVPSRAPTPPAATPRPPGPKNRPSRAWLWPVGALIGLAALIILNRLASSGGAGSALTPSKTPTRPLAATKAKPSTTPTLIPSPTPTRTPTATKITPSATPTAVLPSPTPTRTPTPTPTPTPTFAVGDTRTRATDGMVMVYVPSGTFWMGGGESDSEAQGTEFPQHRVTLDGFWIDRTEVTNAQYALCVADGECGESPRAGDDQFNGDDYPVVDVLWSEADAYCRWAGVQLPTEAQWEYAARGEEGTIYPWGDEFNCRRGNFDDETELTDYVVPGGEGCDGYARTAPVSSFPDGASWCGALNLAGNVWEWTADWYGDYSAEDQTNPTGPAVGTLRVLRGGGWYDTEEVVRTVFRNTGALDLRYYGFGFRCAAGTPGW